MKTKQELLDMAKPLMDRFDQLHGGLLQPRVWAITWKEGADLAYVQAAQLKLAMDIGLKVQGDWGRELRARALMNTGTTYLVAVVPGSNPKHASGSKFCNWLT